MERPTPPKWTLTVTSQANSTGGESLEKSENGTSRERKSADGESPAKSALW